MTSFEVIDDPWGQGSISGVWTIGVPFLAIVVSEGFLYFGYTDYALWGHLVTLIGCTLAPLQFDSEETVFQTFALVPLFRLVNLGMPIFFELTIFWLPLVYGPFIPALYLIARPLSPVESPNAINLFFLLPFAVALSILLAEIEYSILQPEALIPMWNPQYLFALSIIMIGFVSFVEELLFRGILQQELEARLGTWSGLVLTSIVFGLMHSGTGIPEEMGFAAVVGFLFGFIYDWTGSLPLIILIHGLLNVFLFAIIPLRGSLLPL